MTLLKTKNYFLAAYQFETFQKAFPKSDKVSEALYNEAYCYFIESPVFSLDQSSTEQALDKLQDRGKFYVAPGTEIYEGQILGEHIRANDLTINITKTKKLTNMRTQSTDDKVRLAPPIIFSLEEALEYIQKDEYCEFTPKSIRMRKIKLKENERRKNN